LSTGGRGGRLRQGKEQENDNQRHPIPWTGGNSGLPPSRLTPAIGGRDDPDTSTTPGPGSPGEPRMRPLPEPVPRRTQPPSSSSSTGPSRKSTVRSARTTRPLATQARQESTAVRAKGLTGAPTAATCAPNRAWLSPSVADLSSRRVMGWAPSSRMSDAQVAWATWAARMTRILASAITHSARGSQYLSCKSCKVRELCPRLITQHLSNLKNQLHAR